jgi:hypothetical protein
MRKMKLDVEQLSVESFATRMVDTEARGTVRGNDATERFCSFQSGCNTCQLSCNGSCATGYNCQQVC